MADIIKLVPDTGAEKPELLDVPTMLPMQIIRTDTAGRFFLLKTIT